MTCLGDNKLVLTTYRLEVVRKSAEESTIYRIDGLRIPFLQRSRANQMFHRIGKGKPVLRGRHTGLLRLASGDVKDRDQQGNVGSGCHRILRESNTQISPNPSLCQTPDYSTTIALYLGYRTAYANLTEWLLPAEIRCFHFTRPVSSLCSPLESSRMSMLIDRVFGMGSWSSMTRVMSSAFLLRTDISYAITTLLCDPRNCFDERSRIFSRSITIPASRPRESIRVSFVLRESISDLPMYLPSKKRLASPSRKLNSSQSVILAVRKASLLSFGAQ